MCGFFAGLLCILLDHAVWGECHSHLCTEKLIPPSVGHAAIGSRDSMYFKLFPRSSVRNVFHYFVSAVKNVFAAAFRFVLLECHSSEALFQKPH